MAITKTAGSSLIFISLLCSIGACKGISVIKRMHSTSVPAQYWSNSDKNVVFLPMVHVGKAQFYANVKELVNSFKSRGYVVYYEGLRKNNNLDSLSMDEYRRKFRKMVGFMTDTASVSYAGMLHEHGLFTKLVDQPRSDGLGIDSKDVQVDIYFTQLVDEYEKMFGTIILEKKDRILPLERNLSFDRELTLPKKNVTRIIVDFRNNLLATKIQSSKDKKIVVVYGYGHSAGTFNILKSLDGSWKNHKRVE